MKKFPTREELFQPLIDALVELGGSGSNDEINTKVSELIQMPRKLLEKMHKNTNSTKFEYEMAWVRTMLKKQGVLENSSRGVWSLQSNKKSIPKYEISSAQSKKIEAEINNNESWKDELTRTILKQLSPSGFERLIQRMLREKGFAQVEVTGRTGDGGIDGKGIAKINGILSFHIIFQCKRYTGKVGAKEIRDFRGAMVGRTDKGLFITTGNYTRAAIEEATRDGAPAIDLMDGDKLAEKLKELGLGVKVELKEHISIDEEWFQKFEEN